MVIFLTKSGRLGGAAALFVSLRVRCLFTGGPGSIFRALSAGKSLQCSVKGEVLGLKSVTLRGGLPSLALARYHTHEKRSHL